MTRHIQDTNKALRSSLSDGNARASIFSSCISPGAAARAVSRSKREIEARFTVSTIRTSVRNSAKTERGSLLSRSKGFQVNYLVGDQTLGAQLANKRTSPGCLETIFCLKRGSSIEMKMAEVTYQSKQVSAFFRSSRSYLSPHHTCTWEGTVMALHHTPQKPRQSQSPILAAYMRICSRYLTESRANLPGLIQQVDRNLPPLREF